MKLVFIAVTMASFLISSNFVFGASEEKKSACDTYLNSNYSDQSIDSQIESIVAILDTAYELNFNPAQKKKLKEKFRSVLEINPKKIDAFHGNVFFACTTDLTAEDLQIAQDEFAPYAN
jgi:hypothetical protein